MYAGSVTPMNTPTKCGCAGGVVAACGTANVAKNRPIGKAKRKLLQTKSTILCPLCSKVCQHNDMCCAAEPMDEHSGREINEGIELCENSSLIHTTGRRSYASMFRGALGRWSGKKRTKRTNGRANVYAETENIQHVPDICTNNNCISDQCKLVHERPIVLSTFATAQDNNNGNIGRELEFSSEKSNSTNDTGSNLSAPKNENGVGWVTRRKRRGRSVVNKENSNLSQQKLPNLPYRQVDTEERQTVTNGNDNGKRRKGRRKYFSSPINKKESIQERKEVQPTYVSFQDEIAQDIIFSVQTSNGDTPDSNDRLNRTPIEYTSTSSGYRPWWSNSDASPFQISPTTPNDDVFTEPNTDQDRGNKRTVSVRRRGYSLNGLKPEIPHSTSSEDEDNARITKLFNELYITFGKKPVDCKTRIRPKSSPELDTRPKCSVPSCRNIVANFQNERVEPIETIMANANLHASLDNAMCMLNESTKLLKSPDYEEYHNPPGYGSRHQSCSVMGAYQALPSHQQVRSRTYSTCSRLETIAEEKSDESPTSFTFNKVEDATSCTFSDSSEYEKLFPYSSRTERSSLVSSATTFNNRDSDSCSSSIHRQAFDTLCTSGNWGKKQSELSPKSKWLMRSCSPNTMRHNSTSTISVQTLRRENGGTELQSHIMGPSSADKCVACEWSRRHHFTFTPAPVIPQSAWSKIVKSGGTCKNASHIHPWGVCSEQHTLPVLCHSHYLQYYQYLQNNQKPCRRQRQAFNSASSQADSVIDYDINEVLSSLDECVTSEHSILSSANSSVTNLHRTGFYLPMNDSILPHTGHVIMRTHSNAKQIVDMKQHHTHKQSDTDVSINSDSAFSTNGSLTPSTRDGVNTDRDSVDSSTDHHVADGPHIPSRTSCAKLSQYAGMNHIIKGKMNIQHQDALRVCHHNTQIPSTRGNRIQSFEESGHHVDIDVTRNRDKRHSLISSVGSSSTPSTSDPLRDSAVHLQDTSSSHSTQLSSDSFYSSRTSFGDKDLYLLEKALSIDTFSRSSSETSLKSEGTLCLSEYAMSQKNLSLYPAQSFPQIADICSPVRSPSRRDISMEEIQTNPSCSTHLEDWIKKVEMTESVMETFMNSSMHYLRESSILNDVSPVADNTTIPDTLEEKSIPKQMGIYDSLTSSSGSSDSNTLGSGSSGSTYATSSLRSYSRFNTFDSSSCVSTDDTGETVIDQYMMRPGRGLHDIEEEARRKRNCSDGKMRYQPSAFHYEHLNIPPQAVTEHEQNVRESIKFLASVGENTDTVVRHDLTKNTKVTISQSKSSSLSCIMTSVTEVLRLVRLSKSLPNIHISKYENTNANKVSSFNDEESRDPISPKYSKILQTKVDSMIRNCNNIDNVITSLRRSLKSPNTSENLLDQKLVELGDILRQKDEMINRLQKMLLAYSATRDNFGLKYPTSATM